MAVEAETRLSLDSKRLDRVRDELNRQPRLADCVLAPTGTREHVDAYFDVDDKLYKSRWSLRLRERDGALRMTLKRPMTSGQPEAKEELETERDGTFSEVLQRVAVLLVEAGVIPEFPADLRFRLLRDGAYAAIRDLGLREMFIIRTVRSTWQATKSGGEAVAEIALDDSEYVIGETSSAREARIEIELVDPARGEVLAELTKAASARFNADQVHESKFERGMVHYRSRNLRDKMESKVSFHNPQDYSAVTRRIENDPDFLPGYRFTRASDRSIEDTYFDTKDYRLFHLGCYLRLRQERNTIQLTFRRLTRDVKYGQVLQQETVVDWSGASAVEEWRTLQRRVVSALGISTSTSPTKADELPSALQQLGLVPSLKALVSRRAWVVERTAPDRGPGLQHVAKLKLDHVNFRRPDDVGEPAETEEFEVTGVEDEDAAPATLHHDSYHTFLAEFVEACAHSTVDGQVRQRISAKYFEGLSSLGVAGDLPGWLTDGRLGLRVTLIRESDTSVEEGQRSRWALIRPWVGLTTMVAGLFAVSNGSDGGLFGPAELRTSAFSVVVQIVGFLAVIGASLYLFRKPSEVFSDRWKIAVVVGGVAAAVAISIPWFGRHATADAVALLGLLPLLMSLGRKGLGDAAP